MNPNILLANRPWPRSQAEWLEHNKWYNHQKLMEWQERKDKEGNDSCGTN